jgi:hypothetical protein
MFKPDIHCISQAIQTTVNGIIEFVFFEAVQKAFFRDETARKGCIFITAG